GAVFTGCLDKTELSQLAELPLVESWGKLVERRLETGEVEDWEMRLVGPTVG
ncbi:3-alpha domain-containing protein, partial [Vibrio parahaemolyticus]